MESEMTGPRTAQLDPETARTMTDHKTVAVIEIRAGIVPGEAMRHHSHVIVYDIDDYNHDLKQPPGSPTRLADKAAEAGRMCQKLIVGRRVYWTQVNYVWL
jgi:hypothetical protein